MLYSRAGYRSARPIPFVTQIWLATHGRSIQTGHSRRLARPRWRHRSESGHAAFAALGQEETSRAPTHCVVRCNRIGLPNQRLRRITPCGIDRFGRFAGLTV